MDPATGLYNFRSRDYFPVLMRWLQNDPIGFEGGDSNLYRPDLNNPIHLTDPTGLVSDYTGTINALRAQLAGAQAALRAAMLGIQGAQSKIAAAQKVIAEINKDLKEINKEVDKLKEQITKLKQKALHARCDEAAAIARDIASLEDKLDQKKRTIQALLNSLRVQQTNLSKAQGSLAAYRNSATLSQNQISKIMAEIAEVEQKQKKLKLGSGGKK